MKATQRWVLVVMLGTGLLAMADGVIDTPRQAELEGRIGEAFYGYAQAPGTLYLAAALLREHPTECREFLDDLQVEHPGSVTLLQAEDALMKGDKKRALSLLQDAAKAWYALSDASSNNTSQFRYPVEVQKGDALYHQSLMPLMAGPGSHRDNWLVRSYVRLEAWDDAHTELKRVWKTHRAIATDGAFACGFDGLGLAFAVDYAFFLKTYMKEPKQAQTVLTEGVIAMDMDRNPNLMDYSEGNLSSEAASPQLHSVFRVPRRSGFGRSAGLTRREYIRIVYGEAKADGWDRTLVKAVNAEILAKKNRQRRVLAQLRMHQGRKDDALALELAYLKHMDEMVPYARLYRIGILFQDMGRLEKAAKNFKKLLTLAAPEKMKGMPDPEEADHQRAQMCRMPILMNPVWSGGSQYARKDIQKRLETVYRALGRTSDAADLSLKRAEDEPQRLAESTELNRLSEAFIRDGREKTFTVWLKKMALKHNSGAPGLAINLFLERYPAARKCAVEIYVATPYRGQLDSFIKQFEPGGEKEITSLLRDISKRCDDPYARLLLLDRGEDLSNDEWIQVLESILGAKSSNDVFRRGKGVYNRTSFRNVYELAYRLLRCYEKTGQHDKLVALGLKVLRGEAPFKRDKPLQTVRPNWHRRQEVEDVLDCIWVLLAHVKTDDERSRLKTAAVAHECEQLRRQVARALGEDWNIGKPTGRSVLTPQENDTLHLLTNRDDIRAISADGRWIGTSWGLIRYDSETITQLPIAAHVQCIECNGKGQYVVGTRSGLFVLNENLESGTVACERVQLPCEPGRKTYQGIKSIVRRDQGRSLWVAGEGGVWCIQQPEHADQPLQARYYGTVGSRLFVHDDAICSDVGIYDSLSDSFHTPKCEPSWAPAFAAATNFSSTVTAGRLVREKQLKQRYPIRLIGSAGGILWADTYPDGQRRHRPGIVDTKTLTVRPLINVDGREEENGKPFMINNDLSIITHSNGLTWFGGERNGGNAILTYDHARRRLNYVRASWETRTDEGGPVVWRSKGEGSGLFGCVDLLSGKWELLPGLTLDGDRGPRFSWIQRPGGQGILGCSIIREWREDNLGFDNNSGMSHHILHPEGGLYGIDTETRAWKRLDAGRRQLSDFYINNLRIDLERKLLYVCSNGGVTILKLENGFPIAGTITVLDGLPSNKVEDVVRIGNRLYFATSLGDKRGGLAVQDLTTGLIQCHHVCDGLESEKIRRLRAEGNHLHILYGTEYLRGRRDLPNRGFFVDKSQQEVGFPGTILNTNSRCFIESNEKLAPPIPPDEHKLLPLLGGSETYSVSWNAWSFIGGTHGLVISQNNAHEQAAPIPERLCLLNSGADTWDVAAVKDMVIASPEALAKTLKSPNGAVRAEALKASWRRGRQKDFDAYVIHYRQAMKDPNVRVRSTALFMLLQARKAGSGGIVPILRNTLDDTDITIRAVAAVELCRAGEPPAFSNMIECVIQNSFLGNLPFGATSNIGTLASHQQLFTALAPAVKTPEQFALFFAFPFAVDTYEPRRETAKALGLRLREHPEWLPHLLSLEQEKDDWSSAVQLAQHVMGYAGPSLLPRLHMALQSDDRVIRSNAARGCGAIANTSSIPHLLSALARESGLSRASCVWALGELKAREAVPRLSSMFSEAKADALAAESGLFLCQQMAAVHTAQFQTLASVNVVQDSFSSIHAHPSKEELEQREVLLRWLAKITRT